MNYSKGEPKKLWKVLKEVTNSKSVNNDIDCIRLNETFTLIYDGNEIANEYDSYSSIGIKNVCKSLFPTSKSFTKFLPLTEYFVLN